MHISLINISSVQPFFLFSPRRGCVTGVNWDFVQTQRRAATAGLGARGADVVAEEGATYKENVKKTLFARYNDAE